MSQPVEAKDSVCWVIPTHEGKIDYYKNHIRRARELASDIVHIAVLSWHSEDALIDPAHPPDFIIYLEDYFDKQEIQYFICSKSIINVKKLFAIKILANRFIRIIVTDSEVELLEELTSYDILNHRREFTLHKVENPYLLRVISSPLTLLRDKNERKLIYESFVEKKMYGWFADLPIYDAHIARKLFERYGLESEADFSKLTFEHFDYILYQYHVALEYKSFFKKEFIFIEQEMPDFGGSLWEMGYIDKKALEYFKSYGFAQNVLWVSNALLLDEAPSAKMLFNIDRDYSKKTIFQKIKSLFRWRISY